MHVVWFKRDLRVADHAPLRAAARQGRCLCLYVYEPDVVNGEHFDPSHLVFINESLAELDSALRALGAQLTYRHGAMPDVLGQLHARQPIEGLWSHEEIGDAISYARDRRVAAWARQQGIAWHESQGCGVVRRLPTRDGWAKRWHGYVGKALAAVPEEIAPTAGIEAGQPLGPSALGLPATQRTSVQTGGVSHADACIDSFLHARGRNYRTDMSSPLAGWSGCSRISPYLAWGNLSVRQVYQRTRARTDALREARSAGEKIESGWLSSLKSFGERQRWHCHFMQKLEDEPDIEFNNMNRAFDGLREHDFNLAKFDAWCDGQTGYPLVDACMRALHRHGWINFRMRAMLVSFASYQLWLHWRPSALHLSRLFLDFEPGIHYSQVQMQSGVTGINSLRIYSPIKQARDQDPDGVFIRRYCPELAQVPLEYLAEPHTMPAAVAAKVGCVIGTHYPAPIVVHSQAYNEAKTRMYSAKGSAEVRAQARQVFERHGSRRGPRQRPRSSTPRPRRRPTSL